MTDTTTASGPMEQWMEVNTRAVGVGSIVLVNGDKLRTRLRQQDALVRDALALLEECHAYFNTFGSPTNQSFGSYDGDTAAEGHLSQAITALLARVKEGRDG